MNKDMHKRSKIAKVIVAKEWTNKNKNKSDKVSKRCRRVRIIEKKSDVDSKLFFYIWGRKKYDKQK
jgi:hypothetical protein